MADVTAMVKLPNAPANSTPAVTPPLVPGGTVWKVVMRRGLDLDKMPNSEENVSAAVAA